jgi:hypothetical protein
MESSVHGRVVIIGEACQTPVRLLKSEVFARVLEALLSRLKKRNSPLLVAVEAFRREGRPSGSWPTSTSVA